LYDTFEGSKKTVHFYKYKNFKIISIIQSLIDGCNVIKYCVLDNSFASQHLPQLNQYDRIKYMIEVRLIYGNN